MRRGAGLVVMLALGAVPTAGQEAVLDTAKPFVTGAAETAQLLRSSLGWPTFQAGVADGLFYRFDPNGYARFGPDERLGDEAWEVECAKLAAECVARLGSVLASIGSDGWPRVAVDGDAPDATYRLDGQDAPVLSMAEWSRPEHATALLATDALVRAADAQPLPAHGLATVVAYMRWVGNGQADDLRLDASPRRPFPPIAAPPPRPPGPQPAAAPVPPAKEPPKAPPPTVAQAPPKPLAAPAAKEPPKPAPAAATPAPPATVAAAKVPAQPPAPVTATRPPAAVPPIVVAAKPPAVTPPASLPLTPPVARQPPKPVATAVAPVVPPPPAAPATKPPVAVAAPPPAASPPAAPARQPPAVTAAAPSPPPAPEPPRPPPASIAAAPPAPAPAPTSIAAAPPAPAPAPTSIVVVVPIVSVPAPMPAPMPASTPPLPMPTPPLPTSTPAPACQPGQLAPAPVQQPVDSLRGLSGVYVEVDFLLEPPALEGRLRQDVSRLIEARFQAAGIRLLRADELDGTPGRPQLELYLSPGDGYRGCPFRVWMGLRQEVAAVRDGSIRLLTVTWGDGGLARAAAAGSAELETFGYYVDRFVEDFRQANPGRATAVPPQADAGGDPGMVRAIQALLGASGYLPGRADGVFGARTQDAIRSFERDNAMPITGLASRAVLERLLARRTQGAI